MLASVAQLVEHQIVVLRVAGSSPVVRPIPAIKVSAAPSGPARLIAGVYSQAWSRLPRYPPLRYLLGVTPAIRRNIFVK